MPAIDGERLLDDLRRLAEFGRYKTGVHRPTYSAEDMAARHWIAARMAEAGLAVELDGIGNVIGRSPGEGPRLMIGSHSESQNHAGWLDGALGVIYGIEVARALQDDPAMVGRSIDVVSFADEEGHFSNFTGSRSFTGLLDEAEIDRTRNRYDGTPLRTALERAGLAGRPRAQIDPARTSGFLEAHIEQGDYLESSGLRIGVVTSVVAIWQYRIVFEGAQNHAGTTRMAVRKDAGLALVRLAAALDKRFPEVAGERTVWTTGRITLEPGAPSIIPGRAEMLFQFRDVDPARLERLQTTLEELVAAADAAGPCRCRLEVISRSVPKLMDAALARRARGRRRAARARRAHAHAERAPATTRRSSRSGCRRRCCSSPASAASATTGPRTRRTRTSCSAARSWRPRPRRFSAAESSVRTGFACAGAPAAHQPRREVSVPARCPQLAGEVAGGEVAGAGLGERRGDLGAERARDRAAGAEAAAGRRVDRARRLAGEADALARALGRDLGDRHRRDQRDRVGVQAAPRTAPSADAISITLPR